MTSVHSPHHQNNYQAQPAQSTQTTGAPTPATTSGTPGTESPAGSEAPAPSSLGADESHTHTLPSAPTEPTQVQFGVPSGPAGPGAPASQGSEAPEMQYQDIDSPAEPESSSGSPAGEGAPVASPEAGEPEPRTPSPQMQQLQSRFDRDGVDAMNDPGVQALLQHVRDSEQKNFKSLIDMLQKSLDRARDQMEVNKKEYMQKTLPKIKQAEQELNELKALEQANRTRAALDIQQ